jgi:hypothetical protein
VSTAEVSDIGGVPEGTVGAGMAGGGTSRSKVPGGVATAPESSCTTSPGLPGPFLPGSSDCTSPSINWKQVDSEAQLACSRVADAEWLLSTCYSELVILHLVRSTGFVVHSGASRTQNVDALFFMFRWAWCGFHKNHGGTCYAKLEFLH